MADLRPLHEWSGPTATLTYWHASDATLENVRTAPISPVPPGYEQKQHLWAYHTSKQQQEEMARLLIVVWDEPGWCDIRIMGHLITTHLRRHDTYHCWFEAHGNTIVRRKLCDADSIQMEATTLGEVNSRDWQLHVSETQGPFDWECFRFGILQRATEFTFFASIDHLHADSTVIAFLVDEIHTRYRALLNGELPPRLAPSGSHLDYCDSQRRQAASATLSDGSVSDWVKFLEYNHGRMPAFPLPLGLLQDRCNTEHSHMDVLDANGVTNFEFSCHQLGARFIGGLLACAAMTERELTGSSSYSVITPTTTRRSTESYRTTGWCMGVVPIHFAVDGKTFAELAVTAQLIFDERLHLAHIPIDRVLELAAELPGIRSAAKGGVMLSYMDTTLPPMSANIALDWHQANGRVYINQGTASQVALWFFRTPRGLSLTFAYPANEIARASIRQYAQVLKNVCQRTANA